MALSALGIVIGKLTDLALKNALELYHVDDQIAPLRMELNLIKGFFKDADSKCNKNNPLVKQWVNELGGLAYRIEDAVDTFLVAIEGNKPPSSSTMGKLKRLGKHPMMVNDLCAEINSIREMLNGLHQRGNQLGIKDIKEENHRFPVQFKPARPSDIDDSEVVGLNSEKDQIISHLLDKNISRRTVLSIVGTGGLGKTTLAQKVYKSVTSVELKWKFGSLTWLSISQKWEIEVLLREILYSVKPTIKRRNPPVTDDDLQMELRSSLSSERYLIILDDVWTVDLWERLRTALPDMNNASRVLITTRIVDVAMAADCNTEPFQPHFLNDDESLALLFRKAFQQPIQPDKYRQDLKNIAERLIKKCGGLPLALVVLGGILSKRTRNSTAWQEVEKTLDWHNDEGGSCSLILALSYEDLPYELKPCFLYFASYPEDYEISADHITKMWVAEGFLSKEGRGTLEDRAQNCLAELVQRSLVLVNKKSISGRSKTCKMHDLLRDLAIHEAKNNNILTVLSEAENHGQVDYTMMRRATIQFCTSIKYDLPSPKTRSLIFFGKQMLNSQGFGLLRVLNFERIDTENTHAGKQTIDLGLLECLCHLRFLGFRYCCYFGSRSVSFRNMKYFETLDLTGTLNTSACVVNELVDLTDNPKDSLWVVPTLRHVISSENIPGPSQWDHLKNIQTLKGVILTKVPVLVQKINLRKLGVQIDDQDEWARPITHVKSWWHLKGGSNRNKAPILGSMVKDGNVWEILNALLEWTDFLISLSVTLPGKLIFGTNGTRHLPCHKNIQELELYGQWGVPLTVEILPVNLVILILKWSKLEEDPMPILQKLQSLRKLKLLDQSYTGTKLICSSAGGFLSLEELKLVGLDELSEWEIHERAMPILNHLKIDHCEDLHILPNLQNVPSLRELVVDNPSTELYERLQSEDLRKIGHIPSVNVIKPE